MILTQYTCPPTYITNQQQKKAASHLNWLQAISGNNILIHYNLSLSKQEMATQKNGLCS